MRSFRMITASQENILVCFIENERCFVPFALFQLFARAGEVARFTGFAVAAGVEFFNLSHSAHSDVSGAKYENGGERDVVKPHDNQPPSPSRRPVCQTEKQRIQARAKW